jgi:hypothetical protein
LESVVTGRYDIRTLGEMKKTVITNSHVCVVHFSQSSEAANKDGSW